MFPVLLMLVLAFPLVPLVITFGGITGRTGPLASFVVLVGPPFRFVLGFATSAYRGLFRWKERT